jgi:hypothetical protein
MSCEEFFSNKLCLFYITYNLVFYETTFRNVEHQDICVNFIVDFF